MIVCLWQRSYHEPSGLVFQLEDGVNCLVNSLLQGVPPGFQPRSQVAQLWGKVGVVVGVERLQKLLLVLEDGGSLLNPAVVHEAVPADGCKWQSASAVSALMLEGRSARNRHSEFLVWQKVYWSLYFCTDKCRECQQT